jgi:hypothetical protein
MLGGDIVPGEIISTPDQAQSIIPATLNLTVTDVATWDIEVKDQEGLPIEGFTPVATPRISYPTSRLNVNFSCTPSNSLGESQCTATAPGFTPEAAFIDIDMGSWTHELSLNFSCPTDWSAIPEQWRITSNSSLIDSPEELELLRCNVDGGHYYIRGIDFSASPDYIYLPIALNNNVTLDFLGAFSNLLLLDRGGDSEIPSLFDGISTPNNINGLHLNNLNIQNLNITSNNPKDFFGIISRNLVDPSVSNLRLENASINLGPHAVSLGVSLFQNITASSPGAVSIQNVTIENNRLSTQAIDEISFLAREITSTAIIGINLYNNIISAGTLASAGLLSSYISGEEVDGNKIANIEATNNAIISTQTHSGHVGGLFGTITSDSKPNILNFYIQELTIIGGGPIGGVVGKVNGDFKISSGRLSDVTLYGDKIGGLFGSSILSSGKIERLKIQMDNTDYLSKIDSITSNLGIPRPDYLNKTQTQLSADVTRLGGLGGLSHFNTDTLTVDQVEIDLSAEAGPSTYAGGIWGQIDNLQNTTSISLSNLSVTTSFSGASPYSSNFIFAGNRSGGDYIFNVRHSLFYSRSETYEGPFTGPLNADLAFSSQLQLENVYIISPDESRDCPSSSAVTVTSGSETIGASGDFRDCNNPGGFGAYNVFYLRSATLLRDLNYSSPSFINFNFTDIWNPGNGVLPVRLK